MPKEKTHPSAVFLLNLSVPTRYGAVWEIAFILEEQGFFTHKEKTLPIHEEKNKEKKGGERAQEDDDDDDNSQTDAGNGRKTNPRRKRGF